MASLSKKEIEEEIVAVKECINAHEQQLKLQAQGVKVNSFILGLLEKELKKYS